MNTTTIPFEQQPSLPIAVDLSQRDKNIFDSWKKVFIYLRNFNAKTEELNLVFDDLDIDEKWQVLDQFATGEIEFRSKELEGTWTHLICTLFDMKTTATSFLSESEELLLVQLHKNEIKHAAQFCKSSLWWAADFAAKQLGKWNCNPWFETIDSSQHHSKNLWSLFIAYSADLEFLAFETSIAKCAESIHAVQYTADLCIQPLLACKIMPFLLGSRTPEWEMFQKLVLLAVQLKE